MTLSLIAVASLFASDEPIAVRVPTRPEPPSYAREVSGLLDGKCTGCHGPALSEGKLKLDDAAAMLKGGKRGPAIVPGQADESLLFRMAAHRAEPFMPPNDKPGHAAMTPEELGLLKLWIDAGAKDDSAEAEAAAKPIELGVLPSGVHPVSAVDITADGKRIASGRGNVVEIFDADSGLKITTLGGHKDLIQSLRFRPDGLALAAGSYQVVTRWDLPRTEEGKTLAGHEAAARAVVASPDGRTLYSSGEDASILVWDAEAGSLTRTIPAHGRNLCLAISADGSRLAAGGGDGLVRVYRVEDGAIWLSLKGHATPVEAVAFVDRGRGVASAGRDGTARIWTLPEPSAKEAADPIVLNGHAGPVVALAANRDGTALASGGEDGTIRLWHPEDGRGGPVFTSPEGPIRGLAFSPGGDLLAAGSGKGSVFLFDAAKGSVVMHLTGLKAAVTAIAFNPGGTRLATATAVGSVKLWDAATGAGVAAFGHAGAHKNAVPPIHAVTFRDETSLVTASEAKTLKLWKCEGSWSESPPLGPHVFRVLAIDYSPDGKLIATGGGDPSRSGELKIWDAATGSAVYSSPETLHSDTVFGVAFSPDGKSLASVAADRFLKVINVADGKEVRSFEGHVGHVLAVDWSEDGKSLVTGGADNVLKVWDFATGDQLRTLQAAGKQVTAVRWSRNGASPVVAGASGDKLVRFWNPGDGGIPRIFNGPSDYVFAVALSKDRSRVVAGAADGVLFLWNGENGQLVRKFEP